jgi:hypothetical protein
MNLSKQSKQLMLFFNKKNHFNHITITNKTSLIVKELYEEILKSYNIIKKQQSLYKATIRKIVNANQITRPKKFNQKSFPEDIRNHINETAMSEIYYSFSLYEREVKVYFIVESDDIEHELKVYNKYVEIIAMWLQILNLYASKECSKSIIIYLYLTSLEKKLPSSNIFILDENNVNTAFTYTCPIDSEIVIFRKEEWFKVLIHETFHNFGLDFSMMNNEVINKCILNIFEVNSEVNAYEAYTEFWAEIINGLFCSFFSLEDKFDYNKFLSNTEFYINFERTFSFFQLVKTLQFMGLKYKDLYSKTEQSRINRMNLYKEKTNVLSYYVLKTIMINNFQGFLDWCKKNNFSLLDFKKTIDNQNEFCKFIQRNYKTKSMLDGIRESEIFFSTLQSKKGNMKYILSNMRMSICELG